MPVLDVRLVGVMCSVLLDKGGGHVLLDFLKHGVGVSALLILEQPLRQRKLVEVRYVRVRSFVLFHYVLGRRVVDAQQLGRLLDGSTLYLDDVDQVCALLGLNLHVATFGPDNARKVVRSRLAILRARLSLAVHLMRGLPLDLGLAAFAHLTLVEC